ncbi:hypothetical protein [Streptomyces sp. NPDC001340]
MHDTPAPPRRGPVAEATVPLPGVGSRHTYATTADPALPMRGSFDV